MYKITFILCTLLYTKKIACLNLGSFLKMHYLEYAIFQNIPTPNTSNPENLRLGTIDL